MSLETGTRIADLVPTNPVGATDFASQGDDHIRLIKACLQGSFPSLGATAVALTGAQLNDAGRKSETQTISAVWTFSAIPVLSAGINVSGGTVTLPAASISDAALSSNIPLKNAANAFTEGQSIVKASNGAAVKMIVQNSGAGAGTVARIQLNYSGGELGYLEADANGNTTSLKAVSGNIQLDFWTGAAGGAQRVLISNTGSVVINKPSSGTALTVGDATDGKINAVLGGAITAGRGSLIAANIPELYSSAAQPFYLGTSVAQALNLFTNSASRLEVGAAGGITIGSPAGGNKGDGSINTQEIYRQGVKAQSLPCITSTSTTLAKGQLHHISGDATLPALDAGEWVCLVNNSGSDITISEHSGDTTYYTSYGVSVSTVTVPARGRLFASGAGSSVVYVSGDISGYT